MDMTKCIESAECSDELNMSINLLLFAHSPNEEHIEELENGMNNPYTNYFFKYISDVGLCVADHEMVRNVHAELLSKGSMPFVYFGYNGDPVEMLPLQQVCQMLTTKKTSINIK